MCVRRYLAFASFFLFFPIYPLVADAGILSAGACQGTARAGGWAITGRCCEACLALGGLLSLSLPRQHLCRAAAAAGVLGWSPHSQCQPPGTRSLGLGTLGVLWISPMLRVTGDTGLPGGNRAQAFLLERWQSRHFLIKFLLSV